MIRIATEADIPQILAQFFQIIFLHAAAAPLGGEDLMLPNEVLALPVNDGIFRGFHLQKFSIRDFQEIGQGQLLINAVGTVGAIAIGAHDTGNTPA